MRFSSKISPSIVNFGKPVSAWMPLRPNVNVRRAAIGALSSGMNFPMPFVGIGGVFIRLPELTTRASTRVGALMPLSGVKATVRSLMTPFGGPVTSTSKRWPPPMKSCFIFCGLSSAFAS